MEANSTFTPILLPDDAQLRTRLAWWITQIGSPPVLGITGAVVIGVGINTPMGWWQTGLYAVLTLLLPVVYILWLLRRGDVSDFHLRRREERIKPMRMSLITAVFGWGILALLVAPPLLLAMAVANLVQAFLYFVITLRWKISIHAAVASALAVLTWHIWGVLALPVMVSVPLIAWSRIHLRRHTVAQTVAGTAVGAAILMLSLLLHGA